ncbi:hypothetical protein FOMG_17567 [Fusarium oxysporum f. sp. melonis 26406]|uniref:Uncharacterized protein n=1 Tax=Fusarium oxysporum f. sp. melonis 26406 TaxID=1089452 RepID=W9ZXH7_FUSOX|nr:hypothetical protein FOMG_17567 [Fusarium oxysporum f. sp. melonis 26406]
MAKSGRQVLYASGSAERQGLERLSTGGLNEDSGFSLKEEYHGFRRPRALGEGGETVCSHWWPGRKREASSVDATRLGSSFHRNPKDLASASEATSASTS